MFGVAIQIFLIDRGDIPDGVEIGLKNFIVQDNRRWEIFQLVDYGEDALMIVTKERESARLFQIIEETIAQHVNLEQAVLDVV